MASKFSQLSLALIEEGQFIQKADADLREVQQRLIEFAREHKEAAEGAKAKLTLEIELSCDSPSDMMFGIKSGTKITVPRRPRMMTVAMAEDGDDDKPALFVRKSGSSKAPPQQGVITTQDGRVVNTDTGEVKDP